MLEETLYARGGGEGGTPLLGEQGKVFSIFSQKRGIQSHWLASWVLHEVIWFDQERMTYDVSCVKDKIYLSINNYV